MQSELRNAQDFVENESQDARNMVVTDSVASVVGGEAEFLGV